jgi:hypothetical protein
VQQSRRPIRNRSGFSDFIGSRLMIFLLAVAVIVVAVVVFRATRSTANSPARTAASGKHRISHARHSGLPAPKATRTPTTHQLQVRAMRLERKQYAARIVPVMDRSTHIFDGAARAAASANGDFNALQRSCSYWGGKVETISGAYEGVPHPYAWWTPSGTLHHTVSGVYHYMLGAIQNCQESVQATDSAASSTAISQMAAAARSLHNDENYARYLALH